MEATASRIPTSSASTATPLSACSRRLAGLTLCFMHIRARAITYHYEREPRDPRVSHALTLEVDAFGGVLKEAAVAYGRRAPDGTLPLAPDRDKQMQPLVTYTESSVTEPLVGEPDDYRGPLPAGARTFELTGFVPTGEGGRFRAEDFVSPDAADPGGRARIAVAAVELGYEEQASAAKTRRAIEVVRTLYRRNDRQRDVAARRGGVSRAAGRDVFARVHAEPSVRRVSAGPWI